LQRFRSYLGDNFPDTGGVTQGLSGHAVHRRRQLAGVAFQHQGKRQKTPRDRRILDLRREGSKLRRRMLQASDLHRLTHVTPPMPLSLGTESTAN
jgi:hypothetical protein